MLECVRKHRQEKAQESRRKLTETALSLFARNGFAGTNMRAISRGAGMADGLVYHYFPGGKQELLQEIVKEKLAGIETHIQAWDTEMTGVSLEVALERVLDTATAIFEENFELFQLVIRDPEAHQVLEFPKLYQVLLGQQQWLPSLLERQMREGTLREMDVACEADTIFALITNYFLGRLAGLQDHYYYTEDHCRKLLRNHCCALRAVPAKLDRGEGTPGL